MCFNASSFFFNSSLSQVRDEYLCQMLIDDTIDFGAAADDCALLPSVQLLLERYFADARLSYAVVLTLPFSRGYALLLADLLNSRTYC